MSWRMKGKNIDGGEVKISVLRGVTRQRRRFSSLWPVLVYGSLAGILVGYWQHVFSPLFAAPETKSTSKATSPPLAALAGKVAEFVGRPEPQITDFQRRIAEAAEIQLASETRYSSDYFRIAYPGGDVPSHVGTGADVIVRSLRAVGIDLQREIHEDRKQNPHHYPLKRWKNKEPDPNIDHRRLANVYAYLLQHAERVTTHVDDSSFVHYQPGDIVMWSWGIGEYPDHAGIVSLRKNTDGVPYVIDLHPKASKITGDNLVTTWSVRAHFRVHPKVFGPVQQAHNGL